jgi:hypothetical protein
MKNEAVIEKNKAFEKDVLLSKDPNKALQEMMGSIDALRKVIEEENKALKEADVHRFMDLQERKISITKQYEDHTRQALRRREELKNAAEGQKKALRDAYKDFSRLSQENLSLIDRMRNSIGRLNRRIMIAARDVADKKGVNYGSSGEMHNELRGLSMGLNESA